MVLSRSQKAFISTFFAFILELTKVLSSLILPRLVLMYYGSEVNGLLSSITQFLGYITLLQMGVGGVIRASLFKPLADNDTVQTSKVIKASNRFFYQIAIICCFYVVTLATLYPVFRNSSFEYWFVFGLVILTGLGTAAQYFWGFSYRSLVIADQKVYLYDITQIIAIIINIISSYFLILSGATIHTVKVFSAVIYMLQPIVLKIYCDKHYKLIKNIEPDQFALKQRWAGAGYSLADFIHRNTDVFLLTILSTLKNVSIYSVYSVVSNGLNALVLMCTNSFGAAIGNMLAKKEEKSLHDAFDIYIFLLHFISSIAFSIAIKMIIPFIGLYTQGISDADYKQPIFAVIILCAEMIFCLRQPIQAVITSAGHFRQTQRGAFVEALINIVISIILLQYYGLVGLAIGTLCGMVYRTIDLTRYLIKNFFKIRIWYLIKRYLITFITIVMTLSVAHFIPIMYNNYFEWIYSSLIVGIVSISCALIVNALFFQREMKLTRKKIGNLVKIHKGGK